MFDTNGLDHCDGDAGQWPAVDVDGFAPESSVRDGEFADGFDGGFDGARAQLQDLVLPVAESGTPARTRTAAERAVLVIDAAGEVRRRAAAKPMRDGFVLPEQDGLSLFAVRLATEAAHACVARVDAPARDDRTYQHEPTPITAHEHARPEPPPMSVPPEVPPF